MSNFATLTSDTDTDTITCTGTLYAIEAEYNSGTGTITPKVVSRRGNLITLGTTTLTGSGRINVEVAKGDKIAATLSGSASSPDIDLHFIKIR